MIDKIAKVHNQLSDQNWVWFPFLFLKIQPHQMIDFFQWLQMTICFGGYFAVFYYLKQFIFGQEIDLLMGAIKGLIGFGLWFAIITRTFWNRRARQLNGPQS